MIFALNHHLLEWGDLLSLSRLLCSGEPYIAPRFAAPFAGARQAVEGLKYRCASILGRQCSSDVR